MANENNKYYRLAQDFIKNTDLNHLPIGKRVIDEGNIWVNIVETDLRMASDALLEAHDKYLDIHIPLSCEESYGVKPRFKCRFPQGEINEEDDIIFYEDKIETLITAKVGQQTVFEPEMAHAPLIGEGRIKKAIFKVRIESSK